MIAAIIKGIEHKKIEAIENHKKYEGSGMYGKKPILTTLNVLKVNTNESTMIHISGPFILQHMPYSCCSDP